MLELMSEREIALEALVVAEETRDVYGEPHTHIWIYQLGPPITLT